MCVHVRACVCACVCVCMKNHIYSTLFKIQERKLDRRSKEIEQRGNHQTHTRSHKSKDLRPLSTAFTLNYLAAATV